MKKILLSIVVSSILDSIYCRVKEANKLFCKMLNNEFVEYVFLLTILLILNPVSLLMILFASVVFLISFHHL